MAEALPTAIAENTEEYNSVIGVGAVVPHALDILNADPYQEALVEGATVAAPDKKRKFEP